jgi:2-isopropylmalate synthase
MLTLPSGHQPRYADFRITGASDETLREGGERAPFGADNKRKLRLVEALTAAGIRDIDVGSGIGEAAFVRRILDAKLLFSRIPEDTQFSFNLTLKTWEPLVESLAETLPPEYLADIYVSVGMIEIDSDKKLFERVVDRLRGIGITKFRSSLLNAFAGTVDEGPYEHLMRQIERCRRQGISLIRINDSVGTLLPHSTAVLAANLVHDNPDFTFYLHGHNDSGLGTANSLVSICHGFQMIEGGVAGVGNRAGLPELESLSKIFDENNITLDSGPLDTAKLIDAAQLAEDTFLASPDPYRAVSGFLVRDENAGIVNVPDYLGVSRPVNYFLNQIGLFPGYISQILSETGLPREYLDDPEFIEGVYTRMSERMEVLYREKRAEFTRLNSRIKEFYADIIRLDEVELTALELMQERDSTASGIFADARKTA